MSEDTEDRDPMVRMCPIDETPMNMRDVSALVHSEAGFVCSKKCAEIVNANVKAGYDLDVDEGKRQRALALKAQIPPYRGPGSVT